MANLEIQQKITQMKGILDAKIDEANKAEASREIFTTELKTKFGCKTIEESKLILNELIEEKNKIDTQLEEATSTLYKMMMEAGYI